MLLRGWRESDLEPFAALNADPVVMEYFPSTLTRDRSDAIVRERVLPMFADHGFGWWAVEVPGVAPFVGFVGLQEPSFEAWFTPCVEVGWRLAREHWGHGYATEAARLALAFGFGSVGLDEIVSFTVRGQSALRRGHGAARHALRRRVRAPAAAGGEPATHPRPLPAPTAGGDVIGPLPSWRR